MIINVHNADFMIEMTRDEALQIINKLSSVVLTTNRQKGTKFDATRVMIERRSVSPVGQLGELTESCITFAVIEEEENAVG